MNFRAVGEQEVPAAAAPPTPEQVRAAQAQVAAAQQFLMLSLKALSQRALIAASALFSLVTMLLA
jgi:hypothetical protein